MNDYKQKRLKALEGDIRQAMRDEPRIGYTGLSVQGDVVQLKIRDADKVSEAAKRLGNLLNPLSTGALGGAAVTEFQLDPGSDGLMRLGFSQAGLDQRLGTVVQQSIEVIRRRVDQMGAVEPSIQRQGSDRILVEAPVPHSDAETMTQALNDALERQIRAHMEQWLWVHRRWKDRRPKTPQARADGLTGRVPRRA